MTDRILEIPTDDNGIRIYIITAESIEFHSLQLEKLKSLIDQIENYKFINSKISGFNLTDIHKLFEYNSLLNIAMLDLAILTRQLYTLKNKWELLFYAKQAYALIFEVIQTYNSYNTTFYKLLKAKSPNLENEFNIVADEIRKFKKDFKFDVIIKAVRNQVAAHIDNFNKYYNTITSIDIQEVLKAISVFLFILNQLSNILTTLRKIYENELTAFTIRNHNNILQMNEDIQKKFKI